MTGSAGDFDSAEERSNHAFAAGEFAAFRAMLTGERHVKVLPSAFEKYTDVEPLESGGMGTVHIAFDTELKRQVVLKTSLPEPGYVARLKNEGEALARLTGHKGFVQIHRTGECEGQRYISIDYVGRPLGIPLDVASTNIDEAVEIIARLAESTHYAHRHGIIHRDLKPENVLVGDDGEPKIIDLGLAKFKDRDRARLTVDGAPMGSWDYMSPEQAEPPPDGVDVGTDIYSLGVMLYQLITARLPLEVSEEPDRNKRIEKIWKDTPPLPSRLNPKVHPNLAKIVLKCLQKYPKDRYQQADELARDLRHLPNGPFIMQPDRFGAELWRRVKRHRRIVLPLASFIVSVALGILFHVREMRRGDERMHQINEATVQHAADGWLRLMRGCASDIASHAETDALRDLLRAWNAVADANEGRPPDLVLTDPHRQPLQAYAGALHATKSAVVPIENWQILDAKGNIVARTPEATPRPIIGYDLRGRDYFQGAIAHQGRTGIASVHVSTAYNSIADDQLKYALSAPVVDRDGRLLGVLSASTTTEPDSGDPVHHQERVLLAPFSEWPATEISTPSLARYGVLVGPGIRHGQVGIIFDSDRLPQHAPRSCGHELDEPDANHPPHRLPSFRSLLRDTSSSENWLVAAAPVGKTGFVALAQTRKE